MPLETTLFDAAEHITTPQDQVDLLSDALESGNAAYVADALGAIARARGMGQVARDTGVTALDFTRRCARTATLA